MAATHSLNSTPSVAPVLYVAFELSSGQWKLASSTARGQRVRIVSVPARDTARVLNEIARAKSRFNLPEQHSRRLSLRGRTRWFLAPSLLASSRHQQCDRELVEHRGKPSPPACQGRQLGRCQPGRTAHPLQRR